MRNFDEFVKVAYETSAYIMNTVNHPIKSRVKQYFDEPDSTKGLRAVKRHFSYLPVEEQKELISGLREGKANMLSASQKTQRDFMNVAWGPDASPEKTLEYLQASKKHKENIKRQEEAENALLKAQDAYESALDKGFAAYKKDKSKTLIGRLALRLEGEPGVKVSKKDARLKDFAKEKSKMWANGRDLKPVAIGDVVKPKRVLFGAASSALGRKSHPTK